MGLRQHPEHCCSKFALLCSALLWWRWVVGVGCWRERGEGRASCCRCDVTQTADWLSSRLQAQSAASSSRGGGEESNIWSTSFFPPVASSPGQEEQRADNCMIRGASSPSSRLQARLAWCSVQPASLCGRAVHASKEPLSKPGLGEASAFFFFLLLFFVCFFLPWQPAKNILRVGTKQHPCQLHCAARKRISSEEHHRLGTVTRRRLSATSSLTGPRGDWWLIFFQDRLQCCAPRPTCWQQDCFSWDCCTVWK